MRRYAPPARQCHHEGFSSSVDIYGHGMRLGSITLVEGQWVPVCAHPALAPISIKNPSRPAGCGRRLQPDRDPERAKGALTAHHALDHTLAAAA
jgi:hypothetical protein